MVSLLLTDISIIDHYYIIIMSKVNKFRPITVAAQSKARTVFARSNAGIVGSNPNQGMDVCVPLFFVYIVLCIDSALATD
jgi:hypothetical protein